ncbi:MAG TPA: CsgG/HfaB family protein [Candidatus Angelobacter sp.]|nr:CsgG/HfaB family protein [Candidatus Angelobacter sp.]
MKTFIIPMVLVAAMLGQTPPAHKQPGSAKPSVDTVIELVQGGMSESLVIKTLRSQGTAYSLSPADLLKLQKSGVSESIINVMTDPKAPILTPAVQTPVAPPTGLSTGSREMAATKDPSPRGVGSAPPSSPATDTPSAALATPYPPDLPNTPAARKRRVVVADFDFGALKGQSQLPYPWNLWYGPGASTQNATNDIGKGIRAMLASRLQQSNAVTVLERNAAIDVELTHGLASGTDQGKRPTIGHILGADCIVTGDITVFGRDDKTKKKGFGAGSLLWGKGAGLGGFGQTDKEEKAVVGLEFRIVDAETSEMLLTASARGESTRKSKSLGIEGLGIGRGGAGGGGFGSAMTSSGFAETILGEATIDAVNQIVKNLETKIPQLPSKPRKIEGRLASITPSAAYLAIGNNDGVQPGDRFEVRRIDNEVIDPQTKDPIALEAVKVGELVVREVVADHAAVGDYGGQPLSPEQLKGKGYQARLMSK